MKISCIPVGPIMANCYIAGTEDTVFLVDPGADAGRILAEIGTRRVEKILITHSHYDHIGALTEIKKAFPEAAVCIHHSEKDYIKDPLLNLSGMVGGCYAYPGEADVLLEDGMQLAVPGGEITVIHTPGHTPGCCCFHIGNTLFTGDTLFRESIGRTDLPGGDFNAIERSIKTKLFILPDTTIVLPGHMHASSIDYEKKNNEYIRLGA